MLNLFSSLGCGWWTIATIIMNKKLVGSYTLAHSQNGAVYLLTKTVGFWWQIKIKQIRPSWILV